MIIDEIKQYFKKNKLPRPNVINYIGKWAHGDCFAVTCGVLKLKKYCVYFDDKGRIHSVRKRELYK